MERVGLDATGRNKAATDKVRKIRTPQTTRQEERRDTAIPIALSKAHERPGGAPEENLL